MKTNNFDRNKLLKIMGYFSSPNDGEKLAAINRALSMLNKIGITWDDIILSQINDKPNPQPQPKPRQTKSQPKPRQTKSRRRADNNDYHNLALDIEKTQKFFQLHDKQQNFVLEMIIFRCISISEKQKTWLNALAIKVGVTPINEPSFN